MSETIPPGEFKWEIKEWRLQQLEQAEKDLKRAKKLINRLRIENSVLKERITEMKNVTQKTKQEMIATKNYAKTYAATLINVRISKI